MFILSVLKVCSSLLWERTVTVKLPCAECWQDEWLLLLCLMMRRICCEYSNLKALCRKGQHQHKGSRVVQKAVTALYDVSKLSICVRHFLTPSQCEALQEFLCSFEFSFLFLGKMKLHKYFNCLGDRLFLLYIIVMVRTSAYQER